jgi:hypothetical protein
MINKIKVDISEEAFEKLKRDLKSLNKPIKTVNYKKRNMTSKIKWFVDDLGLNELNAWLWITGGAALTAAALVFLTGGGSEVWRYWRVFFLSL